MGSKGNSEPWGSWFLLKENYSYPRFLTCCRVMHHTWSTENVKDETGQHERQNRPIVTERPLPKFLCPAPHGTHLTRTQRNLLEQGSHLRLLVCQLHLTVRKELRPLSLQWRSSCKALRRWQYKAQIERTSDLQGLGRSWGPLKLQGKHANSEGQVVVLRTLTQHCQ